MLHFEEKRVTSLMPFTGLSSLRSSGEKFTAGALAYLKSIRLNADLASASISGRIEGLDELRGIATLWVLICHGTGLVTWMPTVFAGWGFHGVVLFFIVSGYLITKILLDSSEKNGSVAKFYIRRTIRIWPLMLIVLFVCVYLDASTSGSIVYNFLLINNFSLGYGIEPVFRTDVMWSLAIEEQFYLLWPMIVYVFGRRYLPIVVYAVIVVGFALDAGLVPGPAGIPIFKTTQGCMQYIALGAAVALGRQGLMAVVVALLTVLCALILRDGHHFFEKFRYVWWGLSVFLFAVVYTTIHFRPVVKSGFLAFTGKLCYGLYLIHFVISGLLYKHMGPGLFLTWILFFTSSYVLAYMSFHLIEKPVMRLRAPLEASPRAQMLLLAAAMALFIGSAVVLVSRIAHV